MFCWAIPYLDKVAFVKAPSNFCWSYDETIKDNPVEEIELTGICFPLFKLKAYNYVVTF